MVSEKKTRTKSNWAGLPSDILDGILDRFVAIRDYARFGAVCRTWRLVALDYLNYRRRRGASLYSHQLPLLMIPHPHGLDGNKASLYSPSHHRELKFELHLHLPYKQRFIGSSLGWLFYIHTDLSITLFNPFSPTTTIRLPPVICQQAINYDDETFNFANIANYPFNPEYYLAKAVLSADPVLHPNEYTVMLIYGVSRLVAYITPGGQQTKWFYIKPISLSGVCDIIYSNLTRLFYALDDSGALCSIVPTGHDVEINYLPPNLQAGAQSPTSRHIVESCQGYLLQILRWYSFSRQRQPDSEFKVFKLDTTTPISYWVELKSIGDEVLFLDDSSSSISVMASHFPGCQPGSINYLLPFDFRRVFTQKPFPPIWPPYDMGVHNINKEFQGDHYKLYNLRMSLFSLRGLWQSIMPVRLFSPRLAIVDEDLTRYLPRQWLTSLETEVDVRVSVIVHQR